MPVEAPVQETETETITRKMPLWKVLFHNDDKTTMEFVTFVLMQFFGHDLKKAVEIMLAVHKTGIGIAGIYPREVAELKQEQVTSAARAKKFPLTVTIEPDE